MSEIFIEKKRYKLINGFPFAELIYWVFFTASILIKCAYFQLNTGLSLKPVFSEKNAYMLIATFSIILLVLSAVMLFFNRKRFWALLILDVIITLLIFADNVYFRYYQNALTIPVLFQIGLIGPLGGSIKGLLKFKDIIYLLDFPVMAAGLVFLKKRGILSIHIYKRAVFTAAISALSAVIFFANFGNINTLWFDYDKNHIIKDLGIFYFHYSDVKSYISQNVFADKSLSDEELSRVNSFFANRQKTGSDFRGIAEGKNLIIIQMEAMQEFLINRKINGVEITPNLNNLIKDSLYFNNFYYQVGEGNTSDAEFLCNTSQYPSKQGAVYFRYPMNTYHSLPKALKEKGYGTYAFHAYRPSFWNRTVMYEALGFDTYISDKDYEPGDVIGFGLNDTSFFQQSVKKINKDKPFYGFFITLSSHYAFAPFENYNFDVGQYEHSDIGNYIKAANYVDKSIGAMIEELKKQGLYDNTLLAIYGDHHSFPKGHADEMIEFLGMDNNDLDWIKNQKVPFILHYPGLKNGVVSNITGGEIDIFPTVANLLGIDAPYAFGKDLLNTKKGYAVLRNGSFVTDQYVYISNLNKAYNISSSQPLDITEYSGHQKQFQNELDISDIILEKDVFKFLKNK